MRIYNISFDTVSITVILESDMDLIDFILKEDNWNCRDLYVVDGKLFKKWTNSYSEECEIKDISDYRGIIHSESH